MLTIFNRKMLFTSFSMESQAKVKDALDRQGIHYYEKVINRRSASPALNGDRSRTGSFGESASLTYEYIIYVHKKDFEAASKIMAGIIPHP